MLGEHIRVLKGGRWIHAIDCGDETVLQLVEEAPPPRVRRAYRPEFVAGSEAVEVVTHRERTFPAKEVVRRGYSRASDPALAAMFRDSEAFAEWCKTGRVPGPRNFAVEVPGAAPAAPAPRKKPVRKAVRAKAKAAPARKPASRARPARKAASKPARKSAAKAGARPGPARAGATRRAAKGARRASAARKGRRR